MSLACLTPPLPLPCSIQVALRTNQLGVLYWEDSISLAALLAEDGTIDGQTFLSTWRTLPQELVRKLPLTISDIEAAKAKLQAVNLFVLAHRPVGNSGSNRMLC
jgi:AP-1 complex subunit beta-1